MFLLFVVGLSKVVLPFFGAKVGRDNAITSLAIAFVAAGLATFLRRHGVVEHYEESTARTPARITCCGKKMCGQDDYDELNDEASSEFEP